MGKPVIQQSDWWDQESVLHPLTVGAIAFSCLSIYLRFSSARTMSRTNVITWISSVAIGAILGQIITNPEVDLVRGLLSLILLLTVDYVVTYAMAYSKMAQALFRGRPVLCVFRGKVLVDVCRNNRIERPLVLQALRKHGLVSFEQVECMILETTGEFSVISRKSMEGQDVAESLLAEDIPGYERALAEWNEQGGKNYHSGSLA
ncbi:hypothetical protein NCC49_001012 [Naganishia albida]|nr:hypothetical protein NCC49_001012 [Naganishia albida]